MNSIPVLSIITPVYNGERFIAETIESVLNANIEISYEYIILDDGSSDSTPSILNDFKDRVQIFSHKNVGESSTVNLGLQKARGEFILVLNADDPFLTSELVKNALETLQKDQAVVAIYPDWKVIDENGKTIRNKILPEYSDETFIGRCKCLPGPGTIFRRDTALKIGGRSKNWKFVGDYDFWLRLSREGKILRQPGILAQWRQNADSTSISQRGIDMANERIAVTQTFIQKYSLPIKLQRMALGNCYYLAARLSFFEKKIGGRNLMLTSLKQRRGWPEEAKFYVVFYLLCLPVSSILVEPFKKIIIRYNSYK
jgi:glycosyltransferase involved in cell wall biosynthesis